MTIRVIPLGAGQGIDLLIDILIVLIRCRS